MPVIYWTFLIGAASLAALPFITAGFYSKDQILWLAWAGDKTNLGFFLAALTGAFITSIYTFRMVFIVFFGEGKTSVGHIPGKRITIPLIILAVLSLIGGFIELPHTFGHLTLFSDYLAPVLTTVTLREGVESSEWTIQIIASVFSLAGVYVAYVFWVQKPSLATETKNSVYGLHQFWFRGWDFDTLYDTLFVKPFLYLSDVNKHDVIDKFYPMIVTATEYCNRLFVKTQNGLLRRYLMGIVVGAILILTLGLFAHT